MSVVSLDWLLISDSKRVVAIAYDQTTETIYVRFPNGIEWWYADCPAPVWSEFSAPTTSKGGYIHSTLDHHRNGRHVG